MVLLELGRACIRSTVAARPLWGKLAKKPWISTSSRE
jgi:hypothetical protein